MHIVGKRADGYHLIESVIAFTNNIFDEIKIERAEKSSVQFISGDISDVSNIDKKNNTVSCILEWLARRLDKPFNYTITVKKNIPIAAGIGGGSADAAAVLRFFCKQENLEITEEDKLDIALQVGADIPVCFDNSTSFITGIGEGISKLPNFQPLPGILVNPGISVSTKEIFKKFSGRNFTNQIYFHKKDIWELANSGKNDLQETAELLHPKISLALSEIGMQEGCLVARMSGSGSTCFGIFANEKNAEIALVNLQKKFPWVKLTTLQ